MLSATEILSMRSGQASALPDVCILMSGSAVTDDTGGRIVTYVSSGSVMGRLSWSGFHPVEKVAAERLGISVPYVVTLPAGTEVNESQRIVINGRTFEVKAVLCGGEWETARRVLCAEVL
ncbi:MAG: head-tail adaptor protein [Anaerolineae bacterium]|nr:head-tail adaptor protein [Anaerolineae bacterium]